jgi:hypothetical protein
MVLMSATRRIHKVDLASCGPELFQSAQWGMENELGRDIVRRHTTSHQDEDDTHYILRLEFKMPAELHTAMMLLAKTLPYIQDIGSPPDPKNNYCRMAHELSDEIEKLINPPKEKSLEQPNEPEAACPATH